MKVTLETLKADFEAERSGLAFRHDRHTADDFSAAFPINKCHPSSVCFKAHLYVVARDFGLPAAAALKLSNGAIDPRKGGAL